MTKTPTFKALKSPLSSSQKLQLTIKPLTVPSLSGGESKYSAVELVIDIQRISGGLYWKLFLGLFISFAIAMLTFLVSANDLDARFGLCVGGLFAAVGNKYIVGSILPENSNFSLTDKIHALAFVGIFVIILLSPFLVIMLKKIKNKLQEVLIELL